MASLLPRDRKLRRLVIAAAAVVVVAGGLAAGKWLIWPRVKNWREQRTNAVAREKLSQGDLTAAMTAVRTSLRYNQNNLDAWKLGAEIAVKQKSPDLIVFTRRLAQLQPTLENRLKFARMAVEYNAFPQAQEELSRVGQEGSTSPEFLKLAALVNERLGRSTAAKSYLITLVALKPDDNEARLELARLRLLEGFAENRPAARSEIKSLSSDPALRERALSLLLVDALSQKDAAAVMDYADQLAVMPTASTANQLLVADAYRRFAPDHYRTLLSKLEAKFSETPENATMLAGFLVAANETAEMNRWASGLPEVSRTSDGVQVNNAMAFLLQKKWDDMEAFLRSAKWKETEFLRHAFLAYKHRAVGNERLFAEEWKLAMIEVGNNLRKLQLLLNRINAWNWPDERYELLWKRFSIDPSDPALRQQLISWESNKGNTAGLNRLFARIVELSPQDANSRNNLAYTSLLLGTNLERAADLANTNYKQDPKNPYFAVTQSLALYKQGKVQDALQVIETLDIVNLAQPDRTNLHTLYLVECGRAQEAADLAAGIRPELLSLPEEKRIYESVQTQVAKAERDQTNASRLAAEAAQRSVGATNRKSWIAMLPDSLRTTPSVAMELADSFYGSDDFRGLEGALKGDRWEQNDFLRFALLAYAQRNQGNASDARINWRTALAGAGNAPASLAALNEMCERWGWPQEHIELLARIYQRNPSDDKAFAELDEYYRKSGQTAELARLYEQRCDAKPGDPQAKARFAYYSLLAGTNVTRAHVLAREAFETARDDVFATKVYAFSLSKQSRTGDAWRLLEPLPDKAETGLAQTQLLKAALLLQRKDRQSAKDCLDRFDRASALPEESALADTLVRELSKNDD